uniref:Uncharacterized protein n=1 Tax=Anopheles farauti TaxID=69004 RepID=A0A182Q868_9DIPT
MDRTSGWLYMPSAADDDRCSVTACDPQLVEVTFNVDYTMSDKADETREGKTKTCRNGKVAAGGEVSQALVLMIYLMVAGVILFAYLFLNDWWTSFGVGKSSPSAALAQRPSTVEQSTQQPSATTREKEGASDSDIGDSCDTEPPIRTKVLTNGNSSAVYQSIVDAATDQLTQQLKQASVSNANFVHQRPHPLQQRKQKRLNRPQDRACYVNGQLEQRSEPGTVDTNDNHIKMDGTNDPNAVAPTGDENSSTGQERASFIVGEEDSQLDDEMEANDAFPQTMENGGGLRNCSSYEMNLSEKRRRLRVDYDAAR